jgi:hypothetical protein
MKNTLVSLAILGLLSLAPAGALAAPVASRGQRAVVAAPYPIPPATPSTPAAAARVSASDVASQLSDTTPTALAKGRIELHAAASGRGTVSIVLSVKLHGKVVVIGSGRQSVDVAGALEVPIELTSAGKSVLAGHKHLKITVAVVFHPRHGAKKTASLKTTLK